MFIKYAHPSTTLVQSQSSTSVSFHSIKILPYKKKKAKVVRELTRREGKKYEETALRKN